MTAPKPASHSPKVARRRAVRAGLPLLVIVVAWCTAVQAADEPAPISLSNEHVGMTSSEIQASQAPPPAPPSTPAPAASTTPPGPDELKANAAELASIAEQKKKHALELARAADDAKLALEAAEAGLIPGIGANQDAAPGYETCVEAAIRRGESYGASDKLCRAVFGGAP